VRRGKLQSALRARDDRGKHLQRRVCVLPSPRFCRRVNHVPEFPVGEYENYERRRGGGSPPDLKPGGTLLRKRLRIACEDRHPSIQVEQPIDVAKALHQPATEKARAAGDEDALTRSSSHSGAVWVKTNSMS